MTLFPLKKLPPLAKRGDHWGAPISCQRYTRMRANNWLINALLPTTCILCGTPGGGIPNLCDACRVDLPWIGDACTRCARSMPANGMCSHCRRHPPAYHGIQATFAYQPPASDLIKLGKFHGDLGALSVLGTLMAEKLGHDSGPLPRLLVPVPLTPQRWRERGFNQAAELALKIGRVLGIPTDLGLCSRVRHAVPQLALKGVAARRRNVRGAFAVKTSVRIPDDIALVDDVLTTGATAEAATRVLRRAGAKQVRLWVCARTMSD